MTSWLADHLREASWRGVPFFVNDAERVVGQRVITHIFPKRDRPYHEFLGLSPREHHVGAILIGDDLMSQVRALEDAIEQPGLGQLRHPWYGELQAVVSRPARVHHSTRHGRVAYISVVFEEAGTVPSPTLRPETGAATEAAAEAAQAETSAAFAQTYDAAGVPDFVTESATSLLSRLATFGPAIGAELGLAARLQAAGQASARAALAATKAAEAADADLVAARVFGLVAPVTEAARRAAREVPVNPLLRILPQPGPVAVPPDQVARAAVNALVRVGHEVATLARPISTATPSRRTEALNQSAILALAQAAATTELARTVLHVDWESVEQAEASRDRMADLLAVAADRAAELTWPQAWRALTDLRVQVIQDVNARAVGLPHLSRATFPATLPSLAVAHHLYGDRPEELFARAGDIVRRNRTPHPGFVPGGVGLEVLRV